MGDDTIYGEALSRSADERTRLRLMSAVYDPVSIPYADQVELPPAARVLELGPGSGSMATYWRRRVGPGGFVTVVDSRLEDISEDVSKINVVDADLNRYRPPSGSYDLVYSRSTLSMIYQRHRLLRDCVSALVPGAALIVETVDFGAAVADGDLDLMPVWQGIVDGSEVAGTEANWSKRLPSELESAGLTVQRAHSTALIGGPGSPAAKFWAYSLEMIRDFIEPSFAPAGSFDRALRALATDSGYRVFPSLTHAFARRTD